MKRAAVLFSCLLFTAPASTAAPHESASRFDQIAQEWVKARRFMGTVLVARDDQVLFSKAYGSASLELNVPNTTDTRFRIASISKQFTAAAILLLETRGKLSVDDPVKRHYAEAPAAWEGITLAHLLAHTSGIPSLNSLPDFSLIERQSKTPAQLVALVRDKPLDFRPGAEYRYSNSGYHLLGLVIEKAAGVSYAKFLEENLFEAAGMKDTGYDTNAIVPRRAAGHSPGQGGLVNSSFIDMSVPFSAGGLYSTVGDLHRWQQALYGGRLLKPESLEKMQTAGKGDYGFGISVTRQAGQRVFDHTGRIKGFVTRLAYYPEARISVAVLSNNDGSQADRMADLLGSVANGVPVVLPSERRSITVARAVLDDYLGKYRFGPNFDVVFKIVGDQLVATSEGKSDMPLRAESETKFYSSEHEAELEFLRDESNQAKTVIFKHGGRQTVAPRIDRAAGAP
jgi:CubicO group peptidase (beta-lactamase class C family)